MNKPVRGPLAGPEVGDAAFDAYYFEHCCGKPYRRDEHWLTFFGAIADKIVERIRPRKVLDAGCAIGVLVEALRTRGVDAEGIDVSSYAIANVYDPVRPFCRQASIVEEFAGQYDLIVTIEVLEHMPARDGEAAIANMCRHTDDVLFSSTPLDFREPSHVNVQPPEYWAELFAAQGFFRDVDFDATFVTPWAVRFRRSREPLPRILRDYERRFWQFSMERNDTRAFSTEVQRDLAQTVQRLRAAEQERDSARLALDAERAASADARAFLQQESTQLAEIRASLQRESTQLAQARALLESESATAAAVRATFQQGVEQLAEVRSTLEAALQDKLDRRAAALQEALEETHNHLTRKIVELEVQRQQGAALNSELTRVQHDLAHARGTIVNMERSLFWRFRGGWARVSRLLGRPT